MKPTQSVRAQLKRAEEALAALTNAANIAAAEDAWKQFLWQLDRVWNKAEAHFSGSPKWAAWHGRFAKQRKSDPLLRYLFQARNSDEHTINEIAAQRPGGLIVAAADANSPLYIRSLAINGRGDVAIEGMRNGRVEWTPAHLELLPVTTRGVTYPLPTEHLGTQVASHHPAELAQLGLRFYAAFVDEAEAFFY